MITKLLLYKILQLFIMMVIGFVLAKRGIIKREQSDVLSKLCLYLFMPLAIINAFHFQRSSAMTQGLLLAFASAILMHIAFWLLDRIFLKSKKLRPVERLSIMYPNAANLILPVVSYVLGEEWVVYSTAYLSVQLLFLWSHGIRIFSPDTRIDLKKILLNPTIIAIALGLVLLIFHVRLPSFATDITTTFGNMMGPIGMLAAGVLATRVKLKTAIKNKRMYLVSLVRIIAYPVLTILIAKVLSLLPIAQGKEVLLIPFLASTAPTATTIVQFAQLKNADTNLAVEINVCSTILSIVTIPIWVVLYSAFL